MTLFFYACGLAFMWAYLDDEGFFLDVPRENHWVLYLIVVFWPFVVIACLLIEAADRIRGY